ASEDPQTWSVLATGPTLLTTVHKALRVLMVRTEADGDAEARDRGDNGTRLQRGSLPSFTARDRGFA
ncbi:hypothetical protein MOQ72_43250, partial [Saccharopolyspora sp. K220]|uniref:hypothetical protein n=1 Tax=Saccharopolyspora soli TaxID=2926618 RepID=UPI001F569695